MEQNPSKEMRRHEKTILHLSDVIASQDKMLSDYRKFKFKLLSASVFERIKWVFSGVVG